jgi:hypothetical protein
VSKLDRRFSRAEGHDALGLDCTTKGVTLAGVPLLKTDAAGLARRSPDELAALLQAAYGRIVDPSAVAAGLDVVARALNAGDIGRAMVAAVRLSLPALSWDGAVRIAIADEGLAKYSPGQPRDQHGRWTDGAGTAHQDQSSTGAPAPRDLDSPALGAPAPRHARFLADTAPIGGATPAASNSATGSAERPPAGPDPLVVALAGRNPNQNPFNLIVDPKTGALSTLNLAGTASGDPSGPKPPLTVPVSAAQRQQYLEWLVGAKQNHPTGVMPPEEIAARASIDVQSRLLRPADTPAARLARYPHEWDGLVDKAVADYNRRRGLTPDSLRYLDPNTIKAMIMVEAGYDRRTYNSDPMQMNKPGDWLKGKASFGLTAGVPPGPELSVRAGIGWLDMMAYGSDKGPARFIGWDAAVNSYNGNGEHAGNKNYMAEFHAALKLIEDARRYDAF